MGKVEKGQFITPTKLIYAGFSIGKYYKVNHINKGSNNPKIINDYGHNITINDYYHVNDVNTTENMTMPNNHNPIRYGDEYQCAKCGKSWGVDDNDVPECGPSGIIPQPLESPELREEQLRSQVEGLKQMIVNGVHSHEVRQVDWSAREWHIYLNIEKLRATIDTHE